MSRDMLSVVLESILEVMENNELEPVEMGPDTNILSDTPLDSLGLAEVIVLLELKTEKDPFAEGFIDFQTVRELAELYE